MTEGSCLCGSVRFRVTEFESAIFKCHCSKCRKAFGGASSAATIVKPASFDWLQGDADVKEFQTESGFKRRFCPNCGSLLPQYLAGYDMFWIPVGLLESDPGVPLRDHLHVNSRAAWEILDGESRQHGEGFDS